MQTTSLRSPKPPPANDRARGLGAFSFSLSFYRTKECSRSVQKTTTTVKKLLLIFGLPVGTSSGADTDLRLNLPKRDAQTL